MIKKLWTIIFVSIVIIGSYSLEIKKFPPKTEIKIVSYNIHSGLNKDMFPSLFDIIDFLRIENADIICLQEVNESAKAGFQVSSLKEDLDMYSHFGANVVKFGANYGLVTYSKYKIISQNHIYLSSKTEQRGMLHTVVKLGFGRHLNIINLHLGLNNSERKKQLKEVETFVKGLSDPYIVVGDFNDGSMDINENIFKDAAMSTNKDNVLTFSTSLDRIDYILVSPDIEVKYYDVLMKNMSDHYPIVSKFKI
ncbi:endonuclease/exonuclease/phosphatase family protein [Paraclostridium ghonii]|uniref:Endonuclease/exonuclease/phosphatase family metal-dependent hydrolase n=1 Tax=Paraclostridium ghonii TaxID=29358 RepID=A0ABU0N171_9FIRM|nr:endonuclease/exonuclease/phosphatase family protein [Paeniclostridium ghonii]MDQ0556856.1 endonuclease/exonuclease/phosphatase family metal-dependent hydrolase [Paeniclostridium ghonii]